jgi:SAM-dependent methyltransferase
MPQDSHDHPTSAARIVVVTSAERYRHLARELPGPDDAVLEIGCSTGEATRCLAATGARVVAVDVSEEMVARTRAALAGVSRVSVSHLDARDTPPLAALLPAPDLIFLDAGGDARLDAVALILRQCLLAFAPRTTVVRSAELAAVCAAVVEVEAPAPGRLGRGRSQDAQTHALESLLDLSRSAGAKQRAFAARKLRTYADAAAGERLAQLADDPDPRVRRIARAERAGKRRDRPAPDPRP